MITGFNANVRHGGRVFHVQTEDSGRANPHVITHLYYEGTILASERSDYRAIVDAPDLVSRVRQLMEEQHAAVVEALRGGSFDAVISARLEARPAPGLASAHATPPAAGDPPAASGEELVPERPLDAVILDYLVAKARERSRGGRGSRSGG